MTTEPSPTLQDALLAQLPASPDAYPQKLDLVRDAALVIRLDAARYRAASFLDDRILGPATTGAWISFRRVADAAREPTIGHPVHFIFHTGHVGSTLVSRLLDETEAKSADLLMKIGGTVTLDGEMDCKLRLRPAARVSAFEKYARFLDPEGFVPIRMTGSVTAPKAGLPGVGDILSNALPDGDLQDKAKRALEGLLGGKGDERTPPEKPPPPKK